MHPFSPWCSLKDFPVSSYKVLALFLWKKEESHGHVTGSSGLIQIEEVQGWVKGAWDGSSRSLPGTPGGVKENPREGLLILGAASSLPFWSPVAKQSQPSLPTALACLTSHPPPTFSYFGILFPSLWSRLLPSLRPSPRVSPFWNVKRFWSQHSLLITCCINAESLFK